MQITGLVLASLAASFLSANALAHPRYVVVNKSDDTASVVRAEDHVVEYHVPTQSNPHEVAVSWDGRYAYVTDYGRAQGNTITVIDLAENELEATWDLGQHTGPHGIWVSRDNTKVWVTTETSGTVVELHAYSGEILRYWETGQRVSHQLVPSLDETRLYVANIGSGSTTIINLQTDEVVSVQTGAGAEGIDAHPNGEEIWVTNRGANTVSVIDHASGGVVDNFSSGGDFPIRVRFLPDGSRAYVSNAASGVVSVFDTQTREQIASVDVGGVPIGLMASPDGSQIYVALTQADELVVIDTATHEVATRLPTGDEPDGLFWAIHYQAPEENHQH